MNPMSIFTDPVVSCPYNKCHRVALSRIRTHIVKCERNFPPGYKEACPYDATHRLFRDEMQDHIQSCPQRRILDLEAYQSVENHGSLMSDFIARSMAESTIDHGESWDQEYQRDHVSGATVDRNDPIAPPTLDRIDDPRINLRPPRGYSEVMMIGEESDTPISDMESVVSVMGIGRGRIHPNNIQLYRRLNFGRGRSPPNIE